jgi:RHS repeat-associated protein
VRDERVGVGAQTLTLDPPRYTFGVQRFAVDRTSAEGYVTRYEIADSEPTELFDGQIDRRIVYPDGTEASTSRSADRSRSSASDSTGTTSEAEHVTDPIGDADGYVPTRSVITTPEGRRLEVRSETTATLATDTTRSVSAWSETVTVAPETPREASFTRTFDPGTRTWTLTSAEGRVARSVLDDAGRLVRVEPPGQHPLVYTYDARGRLERVERGEGTERRTTTLTYGPRSRHPERIEGSDRRRVTPSFDALGRVSTVTDSAGRTSSFTYDEPTRSTTFAGPGGEAHTMEFDLLGGLASYTPPVADEGGIPWSIARDGDGVLDAFTLGDGSSVSLELDDVGRPEALVLARGRSATTYDPATGQVDTVSMPSRDGDASVTIDLDFDGPLLTRQTWSGIVSGAVAFDYDERWQLDSVQVGASAPVEYAFDLDGLVTRAGPMTITRDPVRGLPVATTVGRITTELVVDAFGAPERRAASWPGGGFSTEVTDFDPAGRIEEIVETDGSTTTTYRYEYDDAGRLEIVRRNGREIASYDYDARGNRDAWSDDRGSMSATFDAQDRLGSTSGALTRSYVHDGHGRVSSWTDAAGTTRLEVDELGNLLGVELPDGTAITYEVDALGRRVARAVDGVRTNAWLYQGDRPIAELDRDGDVRAIFVYASHALAPELMLADGRTYRLVHDHLGSIRRVVDTTTGEVVQALDFDAYGRVLRDTNPGFQPFGYAAGHYDPQTGLVRYGARDYDAAIGRWLAKDPSLIAGGDTNLYVYVGNDPINFVDPQGTEDHWYDEFDTSHDGWLQRTGDFFAGFGDFISGGLTQELRSMTGIDSAVNPCSDAYLAGEIAGVAHTLATALLGNPRAGAAPPLCFVAGTQVATPTGPRSIEEIRPGDMVLAADHDGEIVVESVSRRFVTPSAAVIELSLLDQSTSAESTIHVTGEHPFWVHAEGWRAAFDLQIGDELRDASGSSAIIVHGLQSLAESRTVYNIEVGSHHNYFASEHAVLVHNRCLRPEDLGLTRAQLLSWRGTVVDVGSVRTVSVGWVERAANIGILDINPRAVLRTLTNTARSQGRSMLHIEISASSHAGIHRFLSASGGSLTKLRGGIYRYAFALR